MIQKLGTEIDVFDSKIKQLMSIIDKNRDGLITLEEFEYALSHLKTKYEPKDLIELFRLLDLNVDGSISVEELENNLSTKNAKVKESL